MSHITASIIAAPFAGIIWMVFLATPLTIDRTEFDKDSYALGDQFIITSTGQKSLWAKRFCNATEAAVYLSDATGLIAKYQAPKNYNDGSIKKVRHERTVPETFRPGPVSGWESVTYKCFGFYSITVHSAEHGVMTVK
jgi:hypothetical protein